MTEPRRKSIPEEQADDEDINLLDDDATAFLANGVPPPIGRIPYTAAPALDPAQYDPFDPANMHVPTDFRASLGVKKVLTELSCRKPAREWWITVHPEYHVNSYFLELKESREIYYVAPALWPALVGESTLVYMRLYLCLTRQDRPFFWPVRLPAEDGKLNEWAETAHNAALRGQGAWIRVQADMHAGHYQVLVAKLPVEVTWPDVSLKDLLRICFKDRLVDSLDHAIVRQLLHCEG
jgi:hypothetical protein